LLENRVLVTVPWQPTRGPHRLWGELRTPPGDTVLDGEVESTYFVP
jgi:hypothetical protein